MKRAIVTSLSRDTGHALCQIVGGPTVDAVIVDRIPCPRSIVLVEEVGPGSWAVIGQTGLQRVVFHEDWSVAYSDGAGHSVGDTIWHQQGTFAAFAGGGFGIGPGVGVMDCGAAAGQFAAIRKDDVSWFPRGVAPVAALWMSGLINFDIAQTAGMFGFATSGVADWTGASAGDGGVFAHFGNNTAATTATLQFQTRDGATQTNTNIGTISGYHHIDIVTCPDAVWAACWFDGAGPIVHTTTIPASSVGTPPALSIYPYDADSKRLISDYVHVELVGGLVRP